MKGTVICEQTKINSLLVYRHTKKQTWRKEERQDITNKKGTEKIAEKIPKNINNNNENVNYMKKNIPKNTSKWLQK
jgi:hypothetical protein